MKTDEQFENQIQDILTEIRSTNPFETFEPHEFEEGKHNIMELYESRIQLLFIMRLTTNKLPEELSQYFLKQIATEIRRERN